MRIDQLPENLYIMLDKALYESKKRAVKTGQGGNFCGLGPSTKIRTLQDFRSALQRGLAVSAEYGLKNNNADVIRVVDYIIKELKNRGISIEIDKPYG